MRYQAFRFMKTSNSQLTTKFVRPSFKTNISTFKTKKKEGSSSSIIIISH